MGMDSRQKKIYIGVSQRIANPRYTQVTWTECPLVTAFKLSMIPDEHSSHARRCGLCDHLRDVAGNYVLCLGQYERLRRSLPWHETAPTGVNLAHDL